MDRRVRWAILGFLVALFCVSGPLLVLYAMGYRFRLGSEEGRTTIRLEERGLILLESTPSGATVSIDGTVTTLKTPASIYRAAPSECAVTLNLDGHHEWKRTFHVSPQTVIRAVKIALSPTKIEPHLVTKTLVSCFALSHDGKFLVYADTQSPPSFWMKGASTDDEPVVLASYQTAELPRNSVVKKIEIGHTNRSALLTVDANESSERVYWLSLREPYSLVRLDSLVSGGSTYRINPRSPQQVFAVSDGRLSRIDVREGTLKGDLSRNVETFEVGEDTIWLLKKGDPVLYVRPLNSNDSADDKELLVDNEVGEKKLLEDRHLVTDGSRNVAVLLARNGVLLRNDSKQLDLTFRDARSALFSPDHHSVAVADETRIHIVDAYPIRGTLPEVSESPQKEILPPYSTSEGGAIRQIFWWDDSAHLLVRRGNLLELIETDVPQGGSCHVLFKNLQDDATVAFDPKEAVVYFTGKDDAGSNESFLYAATLRTPSRGMLDWLIKPKSPAATATLSKP